MAYTADSLLHGYVIRPLIPLNFDSRVCPVKLEIKIPLEVGGLGGGCGSATDLGRIWKLHAALLLVKI